MQLCAVCRATTISTSRFWRLFSQRATVFRQHFKDHIPDKEKLLRRILSTWDIKKSDDVVVKAFGPLLKTKNKENSTPL